MLRRLLLFLCFVTLAGGQELKLPPGIHRSTLQRADSSTLIWYANFVRLDPRRPLAVWMQGSGYHSLFPEHDGRLRSGFLNLIAETLGPDVQVLAVEKRGVTLGVSGTGGALDAPVEYHEFATLKDRAADVVAVLDSLQRQNLLPERVLAIGHSEGADVAAKVAADHPRVSHLAFLSGGGASQLFDFMVLIRKSEATARDKETEIEELWKSWHEIQADPWSISKMFHGHAYRRWASFMAEAPIDNLKKTRAKILIVHGSADTSVPIESADLAAVDLSRAGRAFEYLRLPQADHSLRTPEQIERGVPPLLSLSTVLRRFFLDPP